MGAPNFFDDLELSAFVTGEDNNTVNAFNDILCAGVDDDILVGDVALGKFFSVPQSGNIADVDLFLDVSNFNGDNNKISAFNDFLHDDGGDNLLVGDVYVLNRDVDVELTVENSANTASATADNNTLDAFNDILFAADGLNKLVGDVFSDGADDGEVSLTIRNTVGEGDSADNNTFNAFNDELTAGNGGAADPTLVGDVLHVNGEGGAFLKILNSGGDDNTFNAFNDSLTAGIGINTMVGDVYMVNGVTARVSIAISNSGGDDNTFSAFNDTLTAGLGGTGVNTLVGDVFVRAS